jgi:predicted CopG family antitoxin
MATKTITIDVEAYNRLKAVQHENESFTQTIKRVVPDPVSTEELISLFRRAGAQMSEGFFRGVELALAARNSPADMERMDGVLGHFNTSGSRRSRRTPKTKGRRGKAPPA